VVQWLRDGYGPGVSASGGSADAIVIGAGHNGLVAAIMLADAGWDVVVLEAAGGPGGAVRSSELAAPGYLSDHCSAFYPLAAASPVLRSLSLNDFGLRWRHAPRVLAHVLADGRAAVISRDPAETARSVDAFAPGDGDAWRRAYAAWVRWRTPLLRVLFTPFPPLGAGLTVAWRARTAGVLRLARHILTPVRQLASEMFAGEGAALLLAGCALHTDLSLDEVGSGAYGWLMAMLAQDVGFPVPAGGAQSLTDALVARLAHAGGRIVTGTPAERIEVRHGRAVGVRAGGKTWHAHRAVVADVPAPALFLDLVGARHLPALLVDDLEHFRWDGSTVKIDWALSAPIPWDSPEVAEAGTIHLGGDLADLTRYAAELASGAIPERPFMLAGQMTTADSLRSPAGTETVWAYTHLPHRRDWHPDQIVEHAERMQDVFEGYAPGFGSHVIGRHVTGPAGFERDNPSLIGGAVAGGTAAAYQQLFWRPVPGLGRADTPVANLYAASASQHPGGGVHGAPGANAARAALSAHRSLTGPLYRAAVGLAHRAVYKVHND
jgi:phytoene dehydrogenase-like protein